LRSLYLARLPLLQCVLRPRFEHIHLINAL
jgi:hypothetical protein